MPARGLLYLIVSAVVVAALAVSIALVWSYRPPGSGTAAVATPTAVPPAGTSAPNASGDGQPAGAPTPTPVPSPSTPPSLAKETQPESVPVSELEGYLWPVRNALITSRFAPREAAFVVIDGKEIHDGLDLATHCGDKVRAAHDGTVLYAGRNFDPFFGYWGDPSPIYARLERLDRVNQQPIVVVIDDGNGYRSAYVHLQEAVTEAGTEVKAGDVIGLEGATGYATGCHLHYGLIRMDGEWQQVLPQLAQFGYPPFVRERVNPLDVLPWDDEFAPQKLREKVLGTPTPAPSSGPSTTPPASPSTPPASPSTAPPPTETPTASPRPTASAAPESPEIDEGNR
jgi:murein DD-endopeptidase MepM/ murein hydrolase activator NlpD